MFSAHGIAVVVGAENHASLLGPLGSSFLSLDIWVDEDDSEEAVALLRDLRERDESADDEDDDDDGSDDDSAVLDSPEHGDDGEDGRNSGASSVQLRIDRRRRTGVALLLGCFLTFGTAHMFTRAWMRGIALAALEIWGIVQLADGEELGGFAVAAAILVDLIGALWRVRVTSRHALPAARVHSP